jgi:hypothetical protein
MLAFQLGRVATDSSPKYSVRACLKIFYWSKMAPFRPLFVTKMLIMRCITPLFVPRLGKNVLIFVCNSKFKHALKKCTAKLAA